MGSTNQPDDNDLYDFAPPPDGPPQPVLPVTTFHDTAIAYQPRPTAARPIVDEAGTARLFIPSWKSATALIVLGMVLLALPMVLSPRSSGSMLFVSGHLVFRFAIALISTCLLAWLAGFAFGEAGSYLVKLTAIVTMAEGTLFFLATLAPFCLMMPAAMLVSGLVCVALFKWQFELGWPESLFATIAYWLPGILLIFVEARFISWLARLMT